MRSNPAANGTAPDPGQIYARPRTPDDQIRARPPPDLGPRRQPPAYVTRAYSHPPVVQWTMRLNGPDDGIVDPLPMPYERDRPPRFLEPVNAFYVVWVGAKVGIFCSPEAATQQVRGFKNNRSHRRTHWAAAVDLFNYGLAFRQISDQEFPATSG